MEKTNPRRVERSRDIQFDTYQEFGKYIVADPEICHGRITFRGTRIFVYQVLELLSEGCTWDQITEECHGLVSREAIEEAVKLAHRAFNDHAAEYGHKLVPA